MILDRELETAEVRTLAPAEAETTPSKSVVLTEAVRIHTKRTSFSHSTANWAKRFTANRETQSDPLMSPDDDRTAGPYTVVRRHPSKTVQGGRFVLHEFWEGVVEEIYDTYFVAQLVSQSNPESPEVAEIFTNEVSPADLSLLRAGAIFYWAIGYADSPSGQRSRMSVIRFRRLPSITPLKEDAWIGDVGDKWLSSS